jgi:hypothetical protein
MGQISKTATTFSAAWTLSATLSDQGIGRLIYGYSDLNLDFANGEHTTKPHYASVTNGSGVHTAPEMSANEESFIAVNHSGNTVTYKCVW